MFEVFDYQIYKDLLFGILLKFVNYLIVYIDDFLFDFFFFGKQNENEKVIIFEIEILIMYLIR
jgi:hypothetical protein